MAQNNLRVIYSNAIDYSGVTITASSTASSDTTTANLFKDSKASVWRSATGSTTGQAKANLIVDFGATPRIVGGIILPFTNISSQATIRVRGYTGAVPTTTSDATNPSVVAGGVTVFDTTQPAAPYAALGMWEWGALPLGINSYAFGGGTYGRIWLPNYQQISCTSLSIEIVDPNNTSKYIEAARLIVGAYWSPKYNTTYGLSSGTKDTTTNSRSESGDLISNRGIRFRTIDFDLKWLTPSDQLDMTNIFRANGTYKPLFVSLFPDNDTDDYIMEQSHQLYGKLSSASSMQLNMGNLYSTKLSLEEV